MQLGLSASAELDGVQTQEAGRGIDDRETPSADHVSSAVLYAQPSGRQGPKPSPAPRGLPSQRLGTQQKSSLCHVCDLCHVFVQLKSHSSDLSEPCPLPGEDGSGPARFLASRGDRRIHDPQ